MDRRNFLTATTAAVAMSGKVFAQPQTPDAATAPTVVSVDAGKVQSPLPHFWEMCAGSDRTAVGLRDQWRKDLIRAHRDTGIKAVRCHGLFDDEFAIAAKGLKQLNFIYVDQVYDFMLDTGVRPFVELSFMPEALASSGNRIFFYKGNVSPPRHWDEWRELVQAFTDHCVKRYGIAEVEGWKFEVWNEPNINFWAGTQEEYFELYRQAATAVKAVNSRLQVGGPSTAQLAWIPDLIKYCATKGVPLDFMSTHVYPSDNQEVLFGPDKRYPIEQVIPRGLEMVGQQIANSAMPRLPLWLTEWGSQNPAFIAQTIRDSVGLAEAISYWTFSNVFEELGPPTAFNSTFGMLDQWSIARPSLHAFSFLHRLGEERLAASDAPALATRRHDGSLAIVCWNLIPAGKGAEGNPFAAAGGSAGADKGTSRTVRLELAGWHGKRKARVSEVNGQVGTAIPSWKAMGSPPFPSREQIEALRKSAELPAPATRALNAGAVPTLDLTIPPDGLVLVEIDA